MLMRFNKNSRSFLWNSLFALAGILLLSACASSGPKKKNLAPVAPQAQAAYQRAVVAMKSGQTKRAFQMFNSISKKYPGFSGPQINIGLIYLKKNQLKKAESAFKRAIQINRDNAVSYNLLGVVYRRSGKFNEAKEEYEKALSKDAEYANAHLNLGILYDLYINDIKRALHHYEQYQKYTRTADKKVEKWIVDLNRRNKTSKTSKISSNGSKRG